ncbi:MAG: pyruvate synthase subunit beta [Planctomycetes bacterium]|nr:pyruvate synthase subunit beta [Planctomycetota bacterium]
MDALSHEEILRAGHLACPGCGVTPAYRWALKVLGRRTIVTAPACCFAVIDGAFPYSASSVPFLHAAFEAAPAYASGVRAALDVTGQHDVNVLVWAGDGGTFDIGLQSLSAAAERNEDMIYVCYDNEAYMNTGIQRSSATPRGAWTMTTPAKDGKREPKKHLGEIMAAHRIPYFATVSISHPEDFVRKLETAKSMRGFRLLHYFCPCPTGWKADSRHMAELGRLAVETGVFPLYEVFDGVRTVVNVAPAWTPMKEYLKLQGRFAQVTPPEVEAMEREARAEWARLERRARAEAEAEPAAAPR